MIEFKNFNANDHVKVILTEEGKKILASYWGGKIPVWYKNCVDEQGWWTLQFHTLAHIFGTHLYSGNPKLPFKTGMMVEVAG